VAETRRGLLAYFIDNSQIRRKKSARGSGYHEIRRYAEWRSAAIARSARISARPLNGIVSACDVCRLNPEVAARGCAHLETRIGETEGCPGREDGGYTRGRPRSAQSLANTTAAPRQQRAREYLREWRRTEAKKQGISGVCGDA